MSVTFAPEFVSNVEHHLTCACGEWLGETYPTWDDAHSAVKASNIKPSCEDVYCGSYVCIEPVVAAPEVQMSNTNAATLLAVLGLAVGEDFSDYCTGSVSAEDLMGRILIAQAVNPADEGTASFAEGNMVTCGRNAGYTEGKLGQLASVAEYASQRCLTIQWG